jgi:hypothetical protein
MLTFLNPVSLSVRSGARAMRLDCRGWIFCTYSKFGPSELPLQTWSSPPALLFSPKRGALKLQFPHSDYQVVSRLGKAPAICLEQFGDRPSQLLGD